MGLSKMAMLDRSMLSFVDPLGPKQIIDRQSLVELPSGFLKVKISKESNKFLVEILDFKNDVKSHEKLNIQLSSKSYLAIGDLLIEGRENGDSTIYEFDSLNLNTKRNREITTVLQMCIYVWPNAYKNKIFMGLVHIAIDELFEKSKAKDKEINAWYKIFPRSAFIAGCPIADVTPHCISDQFPSITTIKKSKTCPSLKISAKKATENSLKLPKSPKKQMFAKRVNTVRMTQSFLKLVQRRKSEIPPSRIPVVGVDFGVNSLSTSSVDVGYGTSSSSSGPTTAPPQSIRMMGARRSTLPGKIFRRFSMITTQNFKDKSRRNSSWGGTGKSPLRQFRRTEEVVAPESPWFETPDSSKQKEHSPKKQVFTFPELNFSPKISPRSSETISEASNEHLKDLPKQKSVELSNEYKVLPPIRSSSVSVVKTAKIVTAFQRKSKSATVQNKEHKGTLKLLGRSSILKFNMQSSKETNAVDNCNDNVYDVLLSLKTLPAKSEKTSNSGSSSGSAVSVNITTAEIQPSTTDVSPISSEISMDKNKNFKVMNKLQPKKENSTPKVTIQSGNQNRNNNTQIPKQFNKRLRYSLSHKRSTLLNNKNSSIESSTSSSDRGNTSSFDQDNVSMTDQILENSLTKNDLIQIKTVKQILLPVTQCESDDEYLTCDELMASFENLTVCDKKI